MQITEITVHGSIEVDDGSRAISLTARVDESDDWRVVLGTLKGRMDHSLEIWAGQLEGVNRG